VKATHRFRVAQTADGGLLYELSVDGVPVGRDDFLGVEESTQGDVPESILDLMVRRGVQRTTATAFLWAFLEERKRRQEAGGALFQWEGEIECDR